MTMATHQTHFVQKNPFPNELLFLWDWIFLKCMRPCKYFLDQFLSCFMSTTAELKRPYLRLPYYFVVAPVSLVLALAFLPLCLTAFVLWLPICKLRKPYRFSQVVPGPSIPSIKSRYNITTANLCLLPEFISRINNMSHTYQRAVKIGQNIATQQNSLQGSCISSLQLQNDKHSLNMTNADKKQSKSLSAVKRRHNANSVASNGKSTYASSLAEPEVDFNHDVLETFPEIDILLIQEAWDKEYVKTLVAQLHKVFPYIIYDAGVDSFNSNVFLSNSGQLIASHYPILDVAFNWYTDRCSQCRLASKGLLQVKVDLGCKPSGQRRVGYAASTHLQAYQGTRPIHAAQMTNICEWKEEFRRSTLDANEVILFDVVGGDFNVDNMSPVDKDDWYHPLFTHYNDVCRICPGKDFRWTVGTEMRHIPFYDDLISTPAGLKEALEDPYLLQHYILNADITDATMDIAREMPSVDEHGKPILSPVGGRRRIDYVLYRNGDGVEVTGCNPVTQLAGLTDHVPYSLSFETVD